VFGFSEDFLGDLFLPKLKIYKNNVFDITVEENRFISFPYFFEEQPKKKKDSKINKKGGKE
jgi:hypothetical protein